MLNELMKRLAALGGERRSTERVQKRYHMAWLRGGTLVPGLGLEISEKGLLFATHDAPPGPNVDVALDLGGHRVRARVAIARREATVRDGGPWVIVAGDFTGIAADDWDAIVRFCHGTADPQNKAAEELAALSHAPDDAYRLLPLKVQEQIVAVLIAAGRLAPDGDAKNPLLRMHYAGKTRTGSHRLSVHSRRNDEDQALVFDSFLTVDDAGHVTLER